jgi:hypothetical protein
MLGVAHASKDAITDIVKRLFGPTADRAGQALADAFFEKRTERVLTVLSESTKLVTDAGMEPQPVPGRLLMPILEACSWEEDESLRQKWTALLANAASQGPANRVLPAYVEILRQLTPIQASILEWMYAMKTPSLDGHWPDVPRVEIIEKFQLPSGDYALLITDLDRLQVIEGRRMEDPEFAPGFEVELQLPYIVEALTSRIHYDKIAFTSLGVHFMAACTAPSKPQNG